MRIMGCDLHARQQTLATLDTETGEVVKTTLKHEGHNVREFCSSLPRPVRIGIEATGSMQWFANLMEELEIECRVFPYLGVELLTVPSFPAVSPISFREFPREK